MIRRWLIAAAALLCMGMALAIPVLNGTVQLNHPTQPVRGVDVSHYQGEIDWPALRSQGIEFAYIKATEGSGSVDERFDQNLRGAMDVGLPVGAYHFFSYDSPGETQAQHFIETVPDLSGMLPPVIDVEFYAGYNRHPAGADVVVPQLRAMVDRLADHYGRPPMIYATGRAYGLYIRDGAFDDCALWIRNVYWTPKEDWTLWQYTDRARLLGYRGDTPYIDMDVYCGDRASFEEWTGKH